MNAICGRYSRLLSGTSLILLGLAVQSARAQEATPSEGGGGPVEIVVTGTRITSGFNTPTPVTAITGDDLRDRAPNNLADALNQLPQFAPTVQTSLPTTAATGGLNGQNLLNLRDLGTNRNLVLLDGHRVVASDSADSIDINLLPQFLVKRVDVVTGGASAAYGSDAVSGVVNFVLDKDFDGLKTDVGGGISTYGDLPSEHVSVAGGQSFAHGDGHVVVSAELFKETGVAADQDSHRSWFENAAGQIPNPVVGGQPSILVIPNIRSSLGSNGGLIDNTVLKGTQFLPGGGVAPFNYGTVTGSSWQSGGDGGRPNVAFAPDQNRVVLFGHGEYEVNDHITLFGEEHFATSHVASGDYVDPQQGAANQYTIFSGNAFLPSSIQSIMTKDKISSFQMGRYETEFPLVDIDQRTEMERFVVGAKGVIAGDWTYDASYAYGNTWQEVSENNLMNMNHLYAAVDAVVNPSNGQIVCRATLSGNNPGCVPLNLFGQGSPSSAAINYVIGNSTQYLRLSQNVAQVNVNGDLGDTLSLGAGPISVALGGEYRREAANQTSDALSQAIATFPGVRGFPASRNGQQGSFNFFNPLPLDGSYDIKEGYLELGIPLLKDQFLTKSLGVDLAGREADYSLQGIAKTWKYGANDQITDEFRVRFTRSQDIRAPDVLELFNTATQNSNNTVYHGVTTATLQVSEGNPNLVPERALTTTIGGVYRPDWLSGLETSLDYYDIGIKDAIAALTSQQEVDLCAQGNATMCSNIVVTNSNTLVIYTREINVSEIKTTGYDFEGAYTTRALGGDLGFRTLVNHITAYYTQVPGSAPLQVLDTAPAPKWRGSFQLDYGQEDWKVQVQERYIAHVLMNANLTSATTTSDNNVPSIWYTDINASYRPNMVSGNDELYFGITNLFNKSPPIDVTNPTSFSSPTNGVYDRIGRYFNAGLRMKF